ncbi:MAG TPA: hypothetical protein VFW02_06960 [Candidatus Limnocylindrales bacterium]|nr:hypothetical protein [Candidatus Limnocylindrales bacterium]
MSRRRLACLVLVAVGALAACQASVSPEASSPVPSASAPDVGASAAPTGPSPASSAEVDPDWVTRPALTCGDPGQRFPPEALAGPGLGEMGLDPSAAVLRATIAEAADYPFPDVGWHRVIDGPDGVTFVATGDAETPWVMVTVGYLGGTLQATEYGECHLGIAAPEGVSLATWWLDPDGPPVTPESTELAILLRERDCASGRTPEGRVMVPTIVTAPDAFDVAIGIRKQSTGQDCQGNPAYSMRLVLPEPIGSRGLFDASQFPPRRVTTEDPG